MAPGSFEERLTMLESQMQELRTVPIRLAEAESQILQLRADVRDGFSAIRMDLRAELQGRVEGLRVELHHARDTLRGELGAVRDELRGELGAVRDELRGQLGAVRDELRGEIQGVRGALGAVRDELREDIRIGVEETQRLVRLLHEDLLQRIARIGEQISPPEGRG
jgi:signal transduction histidine kinase